MLGKCIQSKNEKKVFLKFLCSFAVVVVICFPNFVVDFILAAHGQ